MYEQETYDAPPPPPQTNVLGIVGFVLSFCISPLGLILSLIALAKPPRGFAIAGTIIGLLGSVVWGIVVFVMVLAGETILEMAEITLDREEIAQAVASYQSTNQGQLPPDLASLGLPAEMLVDPNGQPYVYTADHDAGTWSLTIAGFDGIPDTNDDIELPGELTSMEVNEELSRAIQEHMQSGR